MRQIEKNNKEFDYKYRALKHRIEILKREEEIYRNHLKSIKRKEQREHMVQIDKMKIKFELSKIKEEQDKEFQQRKIRIHHFKEKIKNNMEEKKIENISKKKHKYQKALNDKYLIKCIIEQINNQQNNKKSYQHEKVKQYYNEYETNKIKKNIIKKNEYLLEYEKKMKKLKEKEKKMKKKCDELLSQEKKCLEKLNQTKESHLRYIENTIDNISKYSFRNFYKIPMRNLNRSMELELYSNDKKNSDYSKSVLSYSVRNMKNKSDKKDSTITEYTQSSSRNIFKRNKNKEKQEFKTNNSLIKRRNKNSDLNDNKTFNKSFFNIKEQNKTARNDNLGKAKKRNYRNCEKNIFTKSKNVEKFLTKKK